MGDSRQLAIVLKLHDEATKELQKFSGEVGSAEKKSTAFGGALGYVASAAKMATVALGTAAIAGATWGIKVAAQLETAEVGLKTLLGSTEEAAQTIERLKKEATRTPFELPGLTQATQLLSSVTKDGNKSVDILLDIGEALAAMGKGQAELDRIVVNLQQVGAIGYASMVDVKQFAYAGIPIFEMLQTETGLAGESLADFISDGQVSFDMLVGMFDKANDAGGKFAGAYENASGTFDQAMSNMKDSFGLFFADVVKQTGLFEALTDSMIGVSNWMANYKTNIENARGTVSQWLTDLDTQTGLVTLLKDAWNNVVVMFNQNLKPALLELWETLKPYKPFLDALVTVFGTMLVIAIGFFIKALEFVIELFIVFLEWAAKISAYINEVYLPVWEGLGSAIAAVADFVGGLIDKLKQAWDWMQKVIGGQSKINSINVQGGAIPSMSSSMSSMLPGRALGGPVTAGMPYMVGERGPELFVPRGSGTIIPNGASGGGVVVNVYGDVSGRELVERVQEAIMQSVRNNVKMAL